MTFCFCLLNALSLCYYFQMKGRENGMSYWRTFSTIICKLWHIHIKREKCSICRHLRSLTDA